MADTRGDHAYNVCKRPIADILARWQVPGTDGGWAKSDALTGHSQMKKWAVIPAVIALLRAHFDRRRGRIRKAKARVEKIQEKYPDVFEFLDAYYGFLLLQGRGDENTHGYFEAIEDAEKRFNANLKSLPDEKNDNQRYIELYCQFVLGARTENFDWEAIISEADKLNPDSLTKALLVLPTRERMVAS